MTLRPHAGQAPIITATQPVVAAIAGTGGGKTVVGMVTLQKWMMERPGEQWLAVEPTQDMLERILIRSAPDRISLLSLLQHVDPSAHYHRGDRAIYSKFGTTLLMSATHPESMEGVHVAGAWLDEAGQMSKLAYETATRRVSYKGGQVLLTTTPYNRGWLYKNVYLPWQAGDPDYLVSRFSSIANPRYPLEFYERNRRTMSEARFRMFHEGGFERPEGMIYQIWNEQTMSIPDFNIPEEWPKFGGLDYGYNHPTAAVRIAESPNGVYYLYNCYRAREKLMAQHYAAIMTDCGSQVGRWYDDPAGAQHSAEMRRLGLPVTGANKQVQAGIDTVTELMATGRLKVFHSCKEWLQEIEGYVWNKQPNDEFSDQPLKIDDDLMDATRYALHTQIKSAHLQLWT